MNKRSLGALIVLNVVLLAALLIVSVSPRPAQAQFGTSVDYVMIAGQTAARNNQNVVYIVDTRSQRMAALLFQSANNTLDFIAVRDLSADAQGTRTER